MRKSFRPNVQMVEIAEFVSRCAKRSDVWDHFGYLQQENVIIKQKVVCKICHAILPYSGNTTNMRAHIDRNHWSVRANENKTKVEILKRLKHVSSLLS